MCVCCLRVVCVCVSGVCVCGPEVPSNLPRGFQRFGFENNFRAGGFSDAG